MSGVSQSEMMSGVNIPSAENPHTDMVNPNEAAEMSRDAQMQRHNPNAMQNGAGKKSPKKSIRMKDGKKVYIVRLDKDKKKYISMNKTAVYLNDIRGKYVYV